jgi:hypothetical protein
MGEIVVWKPVAPEEFDERLKQVGGVYVVRDDAAERCKIGHSRAPYARIKALQTGSSCILRLVCLVAASQDFEGSFHKQFQDRWVHGEWFDDVNNEIQRVLEEYTEGKPIGGAILLKEEGRRGVYEWDEKTKQHIHLETGRPVFGSRTGLHRGWTQVF